MNSITVDGVEYVPKSEAKPTGPREIVTVESGWIFVGDVTEESDYLLLENAKNIRKWERSGFGGLTQSAKDSGAELDSMRNMRIALAKVIHRVPVPEGWDE